MDEDPRNGNGDVGRFSEWPEKLPGGLFTNTSGQNALKIKHVELAGDGRRERCPRKNRALKKNA
ncbi:hypothetical protein EAJ17_06990 [Akkermansia sp. aa_0143]|nr:hypothetical protein EAJ17_06990 [Akkermansia sp. aa_0143]